MPNVEIAATIPPDLMSELEMRADLAARRIIDPEARRNARVRMDEIRNEYRRRHGEVDIAVELIREVSDGA